MRKVAKFIRSNIPFLVILIFSILVRVYVFDYPLLAEETNRDFLVARHIAKYKEFVLLGPKNGTLPSFGNSPAYFYFLATLFTVFDNVMFVSLVNTTMQIFVLLFLYLVVKKFFSVETAIISSLFFGLAKVFVTASVWLWQPYVMYFFIVCAYFFLFFAYERKNFRFLTVALIFLAFSISVHLSALAITPAFMTTAFLILKNQKTKLSAYFLIFVIFALTTIILFLPPIINAQKLGLNLFYSPLEVIAKSPKEFLNNFWDRIGVLLKTFPVLTIITFAFIPYYLRERKYFLLLAWVFSFFLFFALPGGRFFDQHLYPIYPIITILAIEAIRKATLQFPPLFKYFLIAVLIIIVGRDATEKASTIPFERLEASRVISKNLGSEILKIKAEENRPNLNFFQFIIYAPPESWWFEGNNDIIDSIYWQLVEKELSYKFVKVQDFESYAEYNNLNSSEYLILDCLYYQDDAACLDKFSKNYPDYSVLKKIENATHGNSFYVARTTQE